MVRYRQLGRYAVIVICAGGACVAAADEAAAPNFAPDPNIGWQAPRPEDQSAMYRPTLPGDGPAANLAIRVRDRW